MQNLGLSAAQLAQEIAVKLPLGALLRIGDAPHVTNLVAGVSARRHLPAIGERFEGGELAGVTLDETALAALVVLEIGTAEDTWQKQIDWAKALGGALPSRVDYLVLLKNVRGRFSTDHAYWSADEVAGNPEYAWSQGFRDGYQDYWHEDSKRRGVAVRRVAI